MPLQTKRYANESREVTITVADEAVNLRVRPNALTPGRELILADSSGRAAVEGVINLFVDLVESWDVVEEEGCDPIPITPEALTELPSALLLEIMRGIQTALSVPNR